MLAKLWRPQPANADVFPAVASLRQKITVIGLEFLRHGTRFVARARWRYFSAE